MAATLADVARRAGVSAATVSRVLNDNYPVAPATRQRVLRAVQELEYVINGNARALAASTSDLIGVLVNDVADPFFGLIASGVQSETGGDKLAVVCNTTGAPDRELNYLTLLQRQRAAGVVLSGSAIEEPEHIHAVTERLRRLAAAGTRIVLCGRPPLPGLAGGGDDAKVATLAFANRDGARELTEHLLALGHRRIGYVAGPADRTTTRHRLEGHRAALAARGMGAGSGRLIAHCAYDRASGRRATLALLDAEPGLTAIAAANDTMALGVCAALRERGLRIPDDVSVTGFDDLPFSADAFPGLTTVRLPLYQAGALAGRLLMGHESPPPDGLVTIPAEVVRRDSTAPPRRP
ncbi:LacI family transcriptional regulator [Wenjunlia vitaminophila]|uniref:LacI family transcriptional regulator n=1 Tax=Wenjunlia vitaminophila TaxID=76728 RepID=A0A0T6LPE1_WENVI|nr:LacI family DNA-binding transcriptional regulator [Wenjunlia vitaminophila]KRV47817.1 LacI family transcriptional regulator [Wenjunlia vitaminophila]